VLIADAKIVQEIVTSNAYDYIKPYNADAVAVAGNGLLLTEGEDHKRQRKMMNPAFTHHNIKVILYFKQ
jgi:cytochrome P450